MSQDPFEHLSKSIEESKERVEKEQKFYEEILNELNTLPKYVEYFDKFHPHSVKGFKEEFARYKANSLLYEKSYRKMEEEELLNYHETAVNCLWEIQQKKLFTVQCRWRAGLVNLPEVKFTTDFEYYWQPKINLCNFIEPVTQKEIDDYVNYLHEVKSKDVFDPDRYQDYDFIKGEGQFAKYKQRHPYYQWWYNKYGEDELQLPDKRGDREEKYVLLWREETNKRTEEYKTTPDYDSRPYIAFHEDIHFEQFIKKYGDERMLEFKKVKKEIDSIYDEWPYFDECLNLLKEAGEDWPVDDNIDWQQGLIMAALRYKQTMVARALQLVFEDYLFRLESNLAPIAPNYWGDDTHINNMVRMGSMATLRGWVLSGEKGEWHAGDNDL